MKLYFRKFYNDRPCPPGFQRLGNTLQYHDTRHNRVFQKVAIQGGVIARD